MPGTILIFEDDLAPRLHPITLARPAYAITCGSFRLVDWLHCLRRPWRGIVQPHLVPMQVADYEPAGHDDGAPRILVNARIVPEVAALERLHELIEVGNPGAVVQNGRLLFAILPAGTPPLGDVDDWRDLSEYLDALPIRDWGEFEVRLQCFEYPHDVVRYNIQTIAKNLEWRIAHGDYQQLQDGVFLAAGAKLADQVVTDTSQGPVVLETGAQIGPFTYLSGPIHIGPRSRVNEHAALKDCVSIGHTNKIGGEVEASVIESFSNKQHHGFLGHSYLGSWINLGAGTCNSDLKNTYGEVKMEYGGQKVATGMQFVGCIMGDYVKSAINTSVFTGKTIGACSMMYGFVTTNVPSFVNYARSFGQVTELPADVMVSTQRRMFERRGVVQRECDRALIRQMYGLTQDERSLTDVPLSL